MPGEWQFPRVEIEMQRHLKWLVSQHQRQTVTAATNEEIKTQSPWKRTAHN